MPPFGSHKLALPFRSVADLLADYARRDPGKTAIVDLDAPGRDGGASITFGELDQVATDIAIDLKKRGVEKGDRVLLLSDETLEKLLIWLGAWRMGAVICPLNIELNQEHLAELAKVIKPKLMFYHKELDGPALTKGVDAPLIRFGAWKPPSKGQEPGNDPQDNFFTAHQEAESRGHDGAEHPARGDPRGDREVRLVVHAGDQPRGGRTGHRDR